MERDNEGGAPEDDASLEINDVKMEAAE